MAQFKDVFFLVDKVTAPLKKIAAATQKTNQRTQKLKISFKEFNKLSIKEKLNVIGDKFRELGAKISQSGDKFKEFGSKIGAIGKKIGAAYTAIAGTITAISAVVINGANKYAEYGDRIDKMSQKIGMSTKNFQEWDYIMSQNGGNVESLQMGFKSLANQMNGVQKGSKTSIEAFKNLGVSVKNTNGTFRTQDEVFNDAIAALQKIQDPTKKAILGNQLFGRSFIEMKPLLNQSAEAIDELRKKANQKGLVISDTDIKNAVNYKDTMDTFSRMFEAKFASVMMKIMPDISKSLEDIMELMEQNQDVFDTIGESLKWTIATALPAVINSIVWLADMLGNLGGIIGTFIGNILALPDNLSIMTSTAMTNIQILFINAGKLLSEIGEKIKAVFQSAISFVLNLLQSVIEKVSGVIATLGQIKNFGGIGNIAKGLAETAKGGSDKAPSRVQNINNGGNTTNNYDNRISNNYFGGGNFPSSQYVTN